MARKWSEPEKEGESSEQLIGLTPRVRVMRWVDTFRPYEFPYECVYQAAKQSDLEVIKWLHASVEYETQAAVEFAAVGGKLEVVQWLLDHDNASRVCFVWWCHWEKTQQQKKWTSLCSGACSVRLAIR